jgi:hypothetical protein
LNFCPEIQLVSGHEVQILGGGGPVISAHPRVQILPYGAFQGAFARRAPDGSREA